MRSSLLIPCLLLTACVTSGIVQTGPDSYMAEAHSTVFAIDPGVAGAIQNAIEDANEFCAKQGKNMVVMNTQAVPSWGVCGNATVNFVCPDKNGPAYWDPNLQAVPNTEVQVKP
jgi:hypothetical protein